MLSRTPAPPGFPETRVECLTLRQTAARSPRLPPPSRRRIAADRIAPASEFPLAAVLLLSWLPLPRGGGSDMSELGADAIRGVPWPSNGLTEVPFRLYTDPEQYR